MERRPQPVAINVALGTLATTGVALAAYVLSWTPELAVLVIAFANAVIGVVVWWLTQRQVTPIANPALEQGTSVAVLQDGQPKGYTATVL